MDITKSFDKEGINRKLTESSQIGERRTAEYSPPMTFELKIRYVGSYV